MTGTETLVLLHSPLVGPSTWSRVGERLRDAGHQVVVPSLGGITEGPPPYYARLARRVAEQVGASDHLVLVGHSGAGALLPSVADAVPGTVDAAVFVDAILPHPGQTWFDTAPDELRTQLASIARHGQLPPWHEWLPPDVLVELLPDSAMRDAFVAELPALPLAYLEETEQPAESWPPPHAGYVQLSGAYEDEAAEAGRRGWLVLREPMDHLAPLTRPAEVADLARAAAFLK